MLRWVLSKFSRVERFSQMVWAIIGAGIIAMIAALLIEVNVAERKVTREVLDTQTLAGMMRQAEPKKSMEAGPD